MTEPTRPDREPPAPPPPAPPPEPAPAPEAAAAPGVVSDVAPVAPSEPAPSLKAASPSDGAAVPDRPPADEAATPVPVAPVEPAGAEAAPAAPSGRGPAAILGYLGMALLGIVIGAGALALATGGLGAPSPSPSPSPAPSEAPAGNVVGNVDAPVTIEVWADYQCPYCRLEDLLFGGALEREYVMPGIARIVYRDFTFLGQESTDAAVAARCAGAQEPAAQLRYHDALYTFQQGENQGRFVRENLVQIAEIAGVPDQAAFEACLDDPAVAKAVADETLAGRNVGVSSTPTLRLRGPGGERVLTGFNQTWPPLRDAVEAVRVPAASPSPGGSATPAPPSTSAPPGQPHAGDASAGPSTSPSPAVTPAPSVRRRIRHAGAIVSGARSTPAAAVAAPRRVPAQLGR